VTFAAAVVVDAAGRALVVRRPEGGLLAGLWAFPDAVLADGDGGEARGVGAGDRRRARPADEAALVDAARAAARHVGTRLAGSAPRCLAPVPHRFTHLAAVYRPVVLAGRARENENRRWIPLNGPWPVALPVAQQKIARAAAAALSLIEDTSE
jgi:adenine-specific DNA glycosylase